MAVQHGERFKYQVLVSEAVHQTIQRLAKEADRSESYLCEQLVKEALDARGVEKEAMAM